MARSERGRELRERFRKLGEAIEWMDREFPLPPMSKAERSRRRRWLNRQRAEIGMPPLEERDDPARPIRQIPDRSRTR